MEHAVVEGEYITFKHIKTRKVVILEVEVPEELFQHVLNTLGMPIGGESKCVYVALSAEQKQKKDNLPQIQEQTEGEKLRVRAVMLCKDEWFQDYIGEKHLINCSKPIQENAIIHYLYEWCGIKSRSELATNLEAQASFRELEQKYKDWQFENQYSDNLERV